MALVDYSMAFTICREGGHWWDFLRWDKDHVIVRQCVRGCKTYRLEHYDPVTGKKDRVRYKYPPGYCVKSLSRVDAAIECRRLIERLVKSRGVSFVQRVTGNFVGAR